jgi:hypothetical protein
MRVPERFVALLAYLCVCGGVYEEHAQEHYVTGYATRLRIVYLYGCFRADLRALDVVETISVRSFFLWMTYLT